MKKYLIDGNNIIGKIHSLRKLQLKNKQLAREKLAHQIDRFFSAKDVEVFLYFDGFENQKIKSDKIKIIYSEGASADEKIKKEIESLRNKRNIVVVSSDNNIKEFAKVCGCEIISSEAFQKDIIINKNVNEEELRIKEIDDVAAFKNAFGVK